MKKIIIVASLLIIITGCTIVRIDTSNIDNILNVILSKKNDLYNQVGQGYKYYLPMGVNYINSDELNDILYCNGVYYYLNINAIQYYYKSNINYKEKNDVYYSKLISTHDGFKHNGYLEIKEENNLYYIEFVYNYAKIEAIVNEESLNNSILNASYILSTIKYNHDIIDLMLEDDYFTNKTGKYDIYNIKSESKKFVLDKENIIEEG